MKRPGLFIAMFLCIVCCHAAENEEKVDFSGKTIRFIVPFAVGGGTDSWARTVLPFFNDYLPGRPDILIENIPGGNATRAANRYIEEAKPDGLSVLITAASNQLSFLMNDSRVRYHFDRWRPLMAYSAGIVVYTSEDMGVANIQELLTRKSGPLILASMGPTSDDIFVLMAFDLLGIDATAIFGSRGRGPARKLYLRGEANIDFQTTPAYMQHVKPEEKTGKAVPLFTLGSFDKDGQYIRDPLFPNLPNVAEVYKQSYGKAPSGEAWDAWLALYRAGEGSLKLLVVPKETPDPVVAAYAKAIAELNKSPEYIREVVPLLGPESIVGVKEAEQRFKQRTSLPDTTRQWVKEWIYERYEVRL